MPGRGKNKNKGGGKKQKKKGGGNSAGGSNGARAPFQLQNVNMSKIKPPDGDASQHIYWQPTDKNLNHYKKCVFEPEVFQEAWDAFQAQGRKDKMRSLRKAVAYSTCLAIVAGRYHCWDASTQQISNVTLNTRRIISSVSKTHFISSEQNSKRKRVKGGGRTSVHVFSADTLDMVEKLSKSPDTGKIGVLNFASASNPGGGWERGAGAQEESLCRRSTLVCALADPWGWTNRSNEYRIPEFGCVYSPDVCIFRKSFREGFAFYRQPIYANFISVACYRSPPIKDTAHGIRINSSNIVNGTLRKIRRIFDVAIDNQIDTLVLGAWGCGVYANPPSHIALLFKQIMNEYQGLVKQVYFAIPGDLDMYGVHNPNGNLTPFAECFGVEIQHLNDEAEN